ncbi:glycosyltransferase family 4 protein [candidate division KSB1 bacterium]
MNILFTTDTYLPNINGVVTSIENYRKNLQSLGHNLFVVAPKYPSYKFQEHVIPVGSVPFLGEKEYRSSIPFKILLKKKWSKLNIDVIHTHTIFNLGIFGYYIAKRLHIPLIHTYHTYYEEYVHYLRMPQAISKPAARIYSRDYLNKCDLIIAPSQKIIDVLKEYRVKKKIVLLPTGIEDVKKYSGEAVKSFKMKFQKTSKTKILLYTGRIAREKNLELIIKAFINLINEGLDVVLLLVGDGPRKKDLQKLADSEDMSDCIYFTGYIPHEEIGLYYLISDLFLFSSVTDTQGLVILEAFSYGLSVVAVEAGPTSELVENGVNGLLTKNNEYDFFQKIKNIICDEKLLNELKSKKDEKISELSISKQCLKLLNFYKEVINEKNK